jgi:hypothetical protein
LAAIVAPDGHKKTADRLAGLEGTPRETVKVKFKRLVWCAAGDVLYPDNHGPPNQVLRVELV